MERRQMLSDITPHSVFHHVVLGLTATLLAHTSEEQREENQQLGLLNTQQADELT